MDDDGFEDAAVLR